jgi:Zn-dependent protease
MLASNILDIVTLAIILLIAISLHEYSHAYVSYRLWDPTPKLQWRLTTNPLKHIDPIWFLMIFLIWFWWWKPVQINPYYYKNPLKWELLVALAWPAMNLVLAIIWIFVMLVSAKLTWMWLENIMTWNYWFGTNFLMQFSMINICLAVFNMIPLPPLDGFRIVKMISLKFANMIEKYTQYIVIWFLVIVLLWRNPIWQFLSNTSYAIFRLIFTFFSSIFY